MWPVGMRADITRDARWGHISAGLDVQGGAREDRELDVGAQYAHVMLHAYDLTGEERYLEKAEAIKREQVAKAEARKRDEAKKAADEKLTRAHMK